jgi:transcription-repair coupling factor (superfamily II helicase)
VLELSSQQRLIDAASIDLKDSQVVHVAGIIGSSAAFVTANLSRRHPLVALIVPTHEEALLCLDDLSLFAAGKRVAYLPAPEGTPYDGTRPDRTLEMMRASALAQLASGVLDILVSTAAGWLRRTAPPAALRSATARLTVDAPLDVQSLTSTLILGGYQRMPVVEDAGTFAVRGDIVDIWPPAESSPLRVQIDYERLASISLFNPETQVVFADPSSKVGAALITPVRETLHTAEAQVRIPEALRALCDSVSLPSKKTRALIEEVTSGELFLGKGAYLPAYFDLIPLSDHLARNAPVVFLDPAQIVEKQILELQEGSLAFEAVKTAPHFPPSAHYVSETELDHTIEDKPVLCLHSIAIGGPAPEGFERIASPPEDTPRLSFTAPRITTGDLSSPLSSGTPPDLATLAAQIRAWLGDGLAVTLTARVETQAERLVTLLQHRDFSVVRSVPSFTEPQKASLHVITSDLARGLMSPLEGFALITEEEIFGKRVHKAKRSARASLNDALDDLRTLTPGDFVVHVEHGIGRYLGLEHRKVEDHVVELLVVEYQAGDKLLLPIYRLKQIQKFSGEGQPKLDRLGGQTFFKTKSKVRKKVRQIADQLLKLYAERKAVTRAPLAPPGDDYFSFEASFPHEETRDQAAAISDVLEDLQKETVMDRLVCGDVGFGKTEVALRAAFLVAQDGRQVALLCPTTVLAEQHLRTFQNRLSPTGITVEGLSRFQTKNQQLNTLRKLKSGQVDVVIGTHRLLSRDVHFKNLGLLIVDEEQRFGVTHKERLKELRRNVDVLTLSATPIPRTLNLAVGGLRDMSIIATAPQERRSIRTITSRFDERLIESAIRREMKRGGRIYYVHNCVEGIYERASLLRRLVPEARVAVGHGQMTERTLEKTMLGFVQGEFDVLCATAIVESGLDIPEANTIIIDGAELFGLSQLYQLRGRVGRSSERAYCYLLVRPDVSLSDQARARVAALERYTELGSGFHIATMDMELRGAGELLGSDQSGFMAQVGFDLFFQMLEEASADLRGETYISEVDPDLSVDVEALLPETYVEDIGVRLSLYKRYARATSADDIAHLDQELRDRFGSPPLAAIRFSEVMRIKTQLRQMRALGLSATARTATLHLREDTPLNAARLVPFITGAKGAYTLTPDGRITHRSQVEADGLTHAGRIVSEMLGLIS